MVLVFQAEDGIRDKSPSRVLVFFFQAEDGIRDRSPSRGLGDVYKRQILVRLKKDQAIQLYNQTLPKVQNQMR